MTDQPPIDGVIQDAVPVSKGDLRGYFGGHTRIVVGSIDDVRNTDFSGCYSLDLAGVYFNLDSADTTSEDDGETCIIDAAGNRFKNAGVLQLPDIGDKVQAHSAVLDTLAGATPAANTVPYFTSGSASAVTGLTAAGRAMIAADTAKAQRVVIGSEARREVGDADATLTADDRVVGTSAAFTALRSWTLPAANTFNAGQRLVIDDSYAAVTGTNYLRIQRAGSDLIYPGSLSSMTMTLGGYVYEFISDGVGKWTCIQSPSSSAADTIYPAIDVTGLTDSTAIVQAAVNLLESRNGGRIKLLPGKTIINEVLISKGGIWIEGAGWEDFKGEQGANPGPTGTQGTYIYTTDNTKSAFKGGPEVNGDSRITDMAFRQTQPADAPGWTPTAYPPTIYAPGPATAGSSSGALTLERLLFDGCYKWIEFGRVSGTTKYYSGRSFLDGIYGTTYHTALRYYAAADVMRLKTLHVWGVYGESGSHMVDYVQNNAIGIVSGRNDNPTWDDIFCNSIGVGVQFVNDTGVFGDVTRNGVCTKFGFDGCKIGVQVSADYVRMKFIGGYHQSPGGSPFTTGDMFYSVDSGVSQTVVTFTDISADNYNLQAFNNAGASDNLLVINGLQANNWNAANSGAGVVLTSSGNTSVVDNAVLTNGNGGPLMYGAGMRIEGLTNSGTWNTPTGNVITVPDHTYTLVGRDTTDTLTNKSIDAGSNTITGLTTGNFAANVIDTDGALTANSDTRVPSQKAVVTYLAARLAALDVVEIKGGIDCSANPNYPAADAGHMYKVTVAGKIGGASGTNVESGDTLFCFVDGSASGTQAAVGANWIIVQANIDGAVVGPASSTAGNIATFSGSTGKVVQDGGKALPSGNIVGTTDTQTVSGKTYDTASNTFKINGSSGLNSVSDILDLLSATQGTILYRSTSGWVALAPGTSGNFLKTLGSGNDPAWAAVPGGGDMLSTNNLSDVASAATARGNLTAAKSGANSDITSLSGLTTALSVAQGGTGDTGTAWTAWTPTVGSGSGALTSASAAGRYKTIGKTVFFSVTVTITTNGSGATDLNFTLPNTCNNGSSFSGREVAIAGYGIICEVPPGNNTVHFTKADNTYPGANGATFYISGVYEAS